ncbi:MAG: hypothetical protein A3G41_01930 [Elusimicrobia bacterium RIFCSPLOWO2_12_FULL_59_9]|nr:MAG: hypothetical protein A3G41_01930 [Elusimicrobia bacterium RIFCSPLOWO2_12_FULL_59_9]
MRYDASQKSSSAVENSGMSAAAGRFWAALGAAGMSALLAGGCRPGHKALARVGPLTITQEEFERKLNDVSPEYQNYLKAPSGRRQFLDVLIREKMILAAARDSEVPGSPGYRTEIKNMEEEQRQRLEEFKDYLLTKLWLESLKERSLLKVSDGEVVDYHRQHPNEVKLYHILVGSVEEADQIYRQVRAGANFQKLARTKSLDAETASQGGALPAFIYGEILPELDDVAFRMKPNEISGVIRSKFGYHIIHKEWEKQAPLDLVKNRIRKLLEKNKLDAHLASVQDKYPVEVLDEEFH